MFGRPSFALGALVFVVAACGSNRDGFEDGQPPGDIGGAAVPPGACASGKMCVGNAIHECTTDGKAGNKIGECTGKGEVCIGGECKKGCAATTVITSNVGCEFWAVDLDNNNDGYNNAASAPWGLVISNAGEAMASIAIEQNDAEPGQPPAITVWKTLPVAPGKLEIVEMPTREVDGSLQGKNEGPGTMLSSRAFRVTSTEPVVVYQFNALRSQYSNDASLLLPSPSLGQTYRTLSWPSGKPISITLPGQTTGSPIDRGYLTVVGTAQGTTVSVTVAQAILAGGSVPATPKGGTVSVTLNAYDVLNLETDGMPGDMTGSIVTSSLPVAVFVGTELSGGSGGGLTPPNPPGAGQSSSCCLDHLEEQLLPVESYGKKFTIPHSPHRGSSHIEPDYLRFMGVAAAASVKTNLAPPNESYLIQPGEIRDLLVTNDVTVEASEPIAIGQVLVSQGYTEDSIGDPSLTVLPAIDQFRQDYLFLVPGSWTKNYVVISMPEGTNVSIDGAPIGANCTSDTTGPLDGVNWVSRRCPLAEGAHTMTGDKPFGIVAYGYGTAGSYAFVGGSNVKKIYVPPPLR